jgi:hypothetical protein
MFDFDPARPDYLREAIIAAGKEAAAATRTALKARKPDHVRAALDQVFTVATAHIEKNVRMIRRGRLSAALTEREWGPFFDSVAADAFAAAALSRVKKNGRPWTADAFAVYARARFEGSPQWNRYADELPRAIRDAIASRDAAIKAAQPITALEKHRRKCTWSVEQLAEKAGYKDVKMVKGHLSGAVKMRVKAAGRYARAINAQTGGTLTPDDLME